MFACLLAVGLCFFLVRAGFGVVQGGFRVSLGLVWGWFAFACLLACLPRAAARGESPPLRWKRKTPRKNRPLVKIKY